MHLYRSTMDARSLLVLSLINQSLPHTHDIIFSEDRQVQNVREDTPESVWFRFNNVGIAETFNAGVLSEFSAVNAAS